MFCNTYILFFELFMCKVLGLRFFYYKIMIYFLIFFIYIWNLKLTRLFNHRHPLVHLIWLGRIKNERRLSRNGNVKLTFALSHIMPNGCWPNIWRRCMAWWQKRPNLGSLQLLQKVFDIKTMVKWMLASWEMPKLCKGEMIKRLLVAHVPKQRRSG